MKQEKIWEAHTSNISITDIIWNYHNQNIFQRELASLIDNICEDNKYTKVIEIGCERGITNMLLNNNLTKYFLDINQDILEKVEKACIQLQIMGTFINEDMFSMSCSDEFYDVVFNSGVLEHYDKKERIEILREYSRVLKPNGTIILGIPNHYSFPYRSAYIFKKKILRGFQWPFPEEFKIYDLADELRETDLQLIKRITLAKKVIFAQWGFIRPIKKLLIISDYLLNYEGYLTTLVIKKRYS